MTSRPRAVFDPVRLAAVRATGLLDTAAEEAFDGLAGLAANLLQAPFAFVTLVDDRRSFWKSCIGIVSDDLAERQNLVEESFCQYVIDSDRPLIVGDARRNEVTAGNPSIESMGVRAWAGFPLRGPAGVVLGSFCVVDTAVREWTERDVDVLRVLAAAAGREIELRESVAGAQLIAQQRDAETEKLALLAQVADSLGSTLDTEVAVARLARLVIPMLGDWSVISLRDDAGVMRDLGWWHRDVNQRCHLENFVHNRLINLASGAATTQAVDTREPVVVRSAAVETGLSVMTNERARRAYRALDPGSYCVFPLVAGDRVAGVLGVMRGKNRPPISPGEVELGRSIAQRAGLVLDNARLYERQRDLAATLNEANLSLRAASIHDRSVSRALQSAMLTTLPTVAGWELTARYLTAQETDQVGGDWYDVIAQPDGTLTVTIGDVVGHDAVAAATMGQLRAMLRMAAWSSRDTPSTLITQLERAAHDLELRAIATLAVARIDAPDTSGRRRLRWSNAGHPPPLVLHADGRTELLHALRSDLLLGVDPHTKRHDYTYVLPPGSGLVLYTDGLIETPTLHIDTGTARLRDALTRHHHQGADELLDAVLDDLTDGHPGDDVALIIARTPPPQPNVGHPAVFLPSLEDAAIADTDRVLCLDPTPDALASARQIITEHAATLPTAVVDDAVLLASEIITNAVRHGAPAITVRIRTSPRHVAVAVHDANPLLPTLPAGHPDPRKPSGRGLLIVDALATRWGATPSHPTPGKTVWFEIHNAVDDAAPA